MTIIWRTLNTCKHCCSVICFLRSEKEVMLSPLCKWGTKCHLRCKFRLSYLKLVLLSMPCCLSLKQSQCSWWKRQEGVWTGRGIGGLRTVAGACVQVEKQGACVAPMHSGQRDPRSVPAQGWAVCGPFCFLGGCWYRQLRPPSGFTHLSPLTCFTDISVCPNDNCPLLKGVFILPEATANSRERIPHLSRICHMQTIGDSVSAQVLCLWHGHCLWHGSSPPRSLSEHSHGALLSTHVILALLSSPPPISPGSPRLPPELGPLIAS